MIDYFKSKTKKIDATLCENSDLIYMDSIHKNRFERGFSTTLAYKFGALTIRITESNTFIEGSLHRMYNQVYKNESQNYDNFGFKELIEVINYVSSHLEIQPDELIIQNLEYGLNIHTRLTPSVILSAHTIHYKSKPVSINMDEIAHKAAKYYRWQLSEYWIKLYDKGLHAYQKQNILRFEKKITKSRLLSKIGIRTLNDLMNEKLFPLLLEDLIHEWKQMCIVDYLQGEAGMTYDERNLFLIMVNPKTYEAYQNSSKTPKQRKAMQRLHVDFKMLNDRFKFDTNHKEILQSIKEKENLLSQNHQYM